MGITWRLDGITKWGVSWNRGNPKSSILMGTFSINHPFWGTFILGNPQIFDQETFAKMLSHRVRPDGHLGIRGGGEMWTRQPWTKPQHATNIDSIWQCNIVNVLYIYYTYMMWLYTDTCDSIEHVYTSEYIIMMHVINVYRAMWYVVCNINADMCMYMWMYTYYILYTYTYVNADVNI